MTTRGDSQRGAPCPYCGKWIALVLVVPGATLELDHEPDVCTEFWKRREQREFYEGFLDALRRRPGKAPSSN